MAAAVVVEGIAPPTVVVSVTAPLTVVVPVVLIAVVDSVMGPVTVVVSEMLEAFMVLVCEMIQADSTMLAVGAAAVPSYVVTLSANRYSVIEGTDFCSEPT